MNLKPSPRRADGCRYASPARVVIGALAAFVACAGAAPSGALAAGVPQDAYPSPQAIAAHAEFLSQLPAPPGGAGAVCVIDTGVTPLPDTASQIVERVAIDGGSGDDVYHDPSDPTSGHGSFVAGTIASQVDGVGSAGIWPAAKIVSVRVFSQRGRGASAADYTAGVYRCLWERIAHRVSAINMSLSATEGDPAEVDDLQRRIEFARASGVSVVAATGNEGRAVGNVPARLFGVVGVGAVAGDGIRCPFSNSGAGLSVVALGCDLESTGFDGSRHAFAGTSYSTPTVAAALTALRSYKPSLTPDAAERLLIATARPAPGGAQIDVAAAFRAAGLGALVDAYQAPTGAAPAVTSSVAVARAVAPTVPASPRVLARSLRGSFQRVRVHVPAGSTAVFRVHGIEHRSVTGRLRLRTQRWVRVSARTEDEWGQRSSAVVVRPARRRP